MDLRPYQIDAIDRIRESISAGKRRILLVAPTGSGKTVIAAHLLNTVKLRYKSGLFVAHRREIIHQTSDKLDKFGCYHGILLAGHRKSMAPIQVASIQTYVARVCNGSHPEPPADVVIYDEAHRSLAPSYQKVLKRYPNTILIGLTATPCRGDGKGLGSMYEELIEVVSVQELIDQGYLVPTRVYAPSVPDLTGVRTRRGDYDAKELEMAMDKSGLVGSVVKDWHDRAKDRKTVVFASGIAHSKHVVEQFRASGIRAEHLDGDTPKERRDEVLRSLERGDIQVVSSCDVLCEGWDCPPVSCAINLRPTKSYALYLQMAGRVLRPSEGKKDCIVIDHAGSIYRHGFVQDAGDWSLDVSTPIEERRKKEADETRQPVTCRECFHVYESGPCCPKCGWVPTKQAKQVSMKEGRLREVTHVKRKKEDKQTIWNTCLWQAIHKKLKVGAAAHMYRAKTGLWPKNLKALPKGSQWQLQAGDFYEHWKRDQTRQWNRETVFSSAKGCE